MPAIFPLILSSGSPMIPKYSDPSFWRYLPQLLLGFFFVSAAYFKLRYSFFGIADVPLDQVFHFWMNEGFPLSVYGSFMTFMLPYSRLVAALVIALQATVGVLLVCNYRVRLAGALLLFLQVNIFLGTFHSRAFNGFVGISLWLAVYFVFHSRWKHPRAWFMMTLLFVAIDWFHLYVRYLSDDPWLQAYAWQRVHFAQNVMSVSPYLKQWVLFATGGALGPWLWASMWWLHLGLSIGMLTRYRLHFAAALMVLLFSRTVIWTNTIGSEGVLWLLILFLWMTQEEGIRA